MKRPTVHHLLILLVCWAFTNDAWASATPEPSDDALAAEDNQYLHVNPDVRPAGRSVKAWPPADAEPHARPALLLEMGLRHCPGPALGDSPGVRPLIYLLMTLRR
jgi:hypothetical protein